VPIQSGFSGGGQMAAGAAVLRQALTAPIEVISLGWQYQYFET